MPSAEQFPIPIVGASGEPCASCGTPLAADQRYCLKCGARRGGPRLPYQQYLGGSGGGGGSEASATANGAVPSPAPRGSDVSPLGAVLGIALLGGMLLIGVLLGRGTDDSQQSSPQVVTVGGEAATTEATTTAQGEASSSAVTSDWPAGQNGWTVELGTLPKSGTTADDVAATKTDLTDQGATDVGVLDSDLYPTLPSGTYILYSGVYDSESAAKDALKQLSGFSDAIVLEVSADSAAAGTKENEVVPTTPPESEAPLGQDKNGGGVSTDAAPPADK
jgi:hypothetical protein